MCTLCNTTTATAPELDAAIADPATAPPPKPQRKAKAKAKAKRPATRPGKLVRHEDYIAAIYKLALAAPGLSPGDRAAITAIKLTYGAGPDGTRGVTYYNRWQMAAAKRSAKRSAKRKGKGTATATSPPVCFVAICATGQESPVQVCGTTLHELGHVLTGPGHGHDVAWHEACARLGLGGTCTWTLGEDKRAEPVYNFSQVTRIQAGGTAYSWDHFEPEIRAKLQALPLPNDGAPVSPLGALGGWGIGLTAPKLRPCGAGFGTRGGLSRGTGSGSRMLLWECKCDGSKPKMAKRPVKLRHAGTDLEARCLKCGCDFELQDASIPRASTLGTGKLAPGSIKAVALKAARKSKKGKGRVKAGRGPAIKRNRTKVSRSQAHAAQKPGATATKTATKRGGGDEFGGL